MRRFFTAFFRLLAYALMLSIVSSNLALAAYVCPRDLQTQVAAEAMPMENCGGMDVEKPALCATQVSASQLALEHLAIDPQLAPIFATTVEPAAVPRLLSLPLNGEPSASAQLGTDPPYLRTQRFRI